MLPSRPVVDTFHVPVLRPARGPEFLFGPWTHFPDSIRRRPNINMAVLNQRFLIMPCEKQQLASGVERSMRDKKQAPVSSAANLYLLIMMCFHHLIPKLHASSPRIHFS